MYNPRTVHPEIAQGFVNGTFCFAAEAFIMYR
jgi:hypothetical protein